MNEIAPRLLLPLLRGTTDGANCMDCPFSFNGMPKKPVVGEGPDDPQWVIVGEGPGHNETRTGRPFIGASGHVVNKLLAKIGVDRNTLWITNATCCAPFDKATENDKTRAAECCKPRLQQELAGLEAERIESGDKRRLPILTLGAIAARSVIPKESLDAIDPPDTPKVVRKQQKLRQQPGLKTELARRKAVTKETQRQLKRLLKHQRGLLVNDCKRRFRKKPDEAWLKNELLRVHAQLELKARTNAINTVSFKIKEREFRKKTKAAQAGKKKKSKLVKLNDIVGTLFDVDVDGTGPRAVIPGIHPAALLRGGGGSIGGSHSPDMAYVNLIYDAAKVHSLSKGKDVRLYLNVDYELFDADRALALFLRVYREALEEGACSLDLETYVDDPDRHTALQAFVARIRVIGLATKKSCVSLAWDLLPPLAQSLLQTLLANVEMTYHNGLYDRTVLMAHGFIMGSRWFDTLLAHHAAFPGNSHKLQTVAAQFYGVEPWKSEFRNAEEDLTSLAVYNAKDTGSTHALRAPLTLWMKRKNTEPVYQMDKKMSAMASRMHLAGMPVERGINEELLQTFSKGVADSRAAVEGIANDKKLREQIWHHLAIQQAAKKRKLDPSDYEERYQVRLSAMKLDPDWKWKIGAGKHIAALLLAMGVALTARTDGGDVSTKKDVLESLVDVPVVRDILAFRENDKLLSTFIWGIFDRYDRNGDIISYGYADELSRIHPIWNVHRISGRWASQWPVVSNVPKDKWKKVEGDALVILRAKMIDRQVVAERGKIFELDKRFYRVNKDDTLSVMTRPNLRRQIHARPGRVFVGFDFAQIEARVIALISGDPFLCAIFAEGRDPHIECARIIWGNFDSLDPDTRKQLRENVKNIEYGVMYMAQLDTLHQTMLKAGNLIKKADLAVAIKKLLTAMSGLDAWHKRTIQQAMLPPHEIRDFILGRFRTWPMGQAEGPEAVNYGVQTAASAIMNTGMARYAERIDRFSEVDPIGQFHDAALFECWEDDAPYVAADVKECFEQEYERDGRRIPFGIDIKIAKSWDKA